MVIRAYVRSNLCVRVGWVDINGVFFYYLIMVQGLRFTCFFNNLCEIDL